MNLVFIASIIALVVTFGAVYALNLDYSEEKPGSGAFVTQPYYYKSGELISYLNAFFFVFIFSLLFFGFSAPIALGIEAGGYASMLVKGTVNAFDLAFVLPEVLGAYSAILLGMAVMDDFEGRTVFERWGAALKFFVVGLAMVFALYFIRSRIF